MTDYIVRYTLHGHVYETIVRTASSAAAMYFQMQLLFIVLMKISNSKLAQFFAQNLERTKCT